MWWETRDEVGGPEEEALVVFSERGRTPKGSAKKMN